MKAGGTVPLVAASNVINAKLVPRGSAVKWSAVFRVASRDRYLVGVGTRLSVTSGLASDTDCAVS